MEKRKLTKSDIDKVRNFAGFPIAKDEDIIALSDTPFYTPCPNPFIGEFIRENGKPYNEAVDNYHREPFAADVSEGKTDPIYMAHTYHTKVPHKAIMRYILHYTKPGDVIFDGFCGTGMTGVAAQMCASPDYGIQYTLTGTEHEADWGKRKAIISDLSPIATFIAANYNKKVDSSLFVKLANELLDRCEMNYGWMYATKHKSTNGQGKINYVIWSDVFVCPTCGEEFVFWDVAVDEKKNVISKFHCPHCNTSLSKSTCIRSMETKYDHFSDTTIQCAKQVPVLINYIYHGKKYEKTPDENDLRILEKAANEAAGIDIPHDTLPKGDNTAQPKNSHNFFRVDQFYYDRSAIIFGYYLREAQNFDYKSALTFLSTSILTKTGSKLHNIGFKDGKINLAGAMPNVLYVPSTVAERNIIDLLRSKISDIVKIFNNNLDSSDVCIQCCSANDTGIPKNSIDYIFTDPPFGSNINYSELNYIWESWIKVKTNPIKEAIINKSQGKALLEYQTLMTECFSEYCRVLKPGRWMTVEFHNSFNAVWNAIQESILRAGFIVADVRILDKKQGTFKQMTSIAAVKQDLVISAYKPKDSFRRDFVASAGSEETAWAFVRQHLENLPVAVVKNGKIELISERQAYLLFDRMVAYHIISGISVPLDASDFYLGLDEKFLRRDEMYFLPDQVNEYDTTRIMNDIEDIQLSFIVSNEKTAISWLYAQLILPQTYSEIQPKFMQEIKTIDKYEAIPELSILLEDNFLQDPIGRWYIPDRTKEADIIKLREKKLIKEFEGYLASKGKLKLFRTEAIRVGFAKLWVDKNYKLIVETAGRLPEDVIQEDDKLLMYYDLSLGRV